MISKEPRTETAAFTVGTDGIRESARAKESDAGILRRNARNCREKAELAGDPVMKAEYMKQAAMFDELAAKAEKHAAEGRRYEYPEMSQEVR